MQRDNLNFGPFKLLTIIFCSSIPYSPVISLVLFALLIFVIGFHYGFTQIEML